MKKTVLSLFLLTFFGFAQAQSKNNVTGPADPATDEPKTQAIKGPQSDL